MSIFITTIIFFSLVIGFLFASIELVNRSYKNLVVVDEDSLDENSEELDQRSMIFDLINEVENLKKQIEQEKKPEITAKEESDNREKTNDLAGV